VSGVIKVREINFMTWNTQLYEMGNSLNEKHIVKKILKNVFLLLVYHIHLMIDMQMLQMWKNII